MQIRLPSRESVPLWQLSDGTCDSQATLTKMAQRTNLYENVLHSHEGTYRSCVDDVFATTSQRSCCKRLARTFTHDHIPATFCRCRAFVAWCRVLRLNRPLVWSSFKLGFSLSARCTLNMILIKRINNRKWKYFILYSSVQLNCSYETWI